MNRPSRPPLRSLGTKLFASHLLVALVGTLTFLAAVSFIAPALFGRLMSGVMSPEHLMTMGEMMDSVSRAFMQTLLYSLLIAALAAAVTAVAASLFTARRISNPVRHMLEATRRISSGSYGERVPAGENDELGALSESLNTMAAALEATEQRRREFIADVSHELRTPLSTLQGYMEGLMDGVVEPSEETWALLYAEAERMRRLVDDLQQLSSAEAGQLTLRLERIFAGEIVDTATESMLPLFADKGVELERSIPKDLPAVTADRDRSVQVLTNLLNNALRYTPAKGKVTVEAGKRDDEVLFSVRDTGAGMSAEHLPHVFERFYRVEKSRSREGGGSGVGLAISRALIESMGGSIRAESAGPGKGATFSFTLPMARTRK
ncbi:MAG TPA: ATP-binding protein [Rubrobacteraceae bacterium]|nr:ATP-binding protein [Rubrobacteraceae bacterium]